MRKVTALVYDEATDFLVVPDGINLKEQESEWRKWYYEEYCPVLRTNGRIEYMNFSDWLKRLGATEVTDDDITIYHCW